MSGGTHSAWIRRRAAALGFSLCGVVRAESFPELARIQEWLERGYAGEMGYLSDPRRSDPRNAMHGIRSVIVCALNYNTDRPRSTEAVANPDGVEPRGWISRYAWGRDYHDVVREKLEALRKSLYQEIREPFESRVYVDTGPLSERVLAKHAGLGWIGKNTLLLNQQLGSFFFLGVILTSLDLQPSIGADDSPALDLCGSCCRCIDACPTQALVEPYVMDARRCISYLTIELRGSIPGDLREGMGAHVFGCDICQDVCPWNRRAPHTNLTDFTPRPLPASGPVAENTAAADSADDSLFLPKLTRLAAMSEAEFREAFRGSPVKRAKWRGLVRNACIALGNAGSALQPEARRECAGLLERLSASPEPVIAESAQWALARIQTGEQAESAGVPFL
jgi:epoxyqueuosine reductase